MATWQLISGVPAVGYYRETATDTQSFGYFVSAVLTAPGPTLQNAAHVPCFAALAWLWCWSCVPYWFVRPRLVLSAGITATFAVANELTQLFVPFRDASATDILLNLAGVGLGLLAYFLASRRTAWPIAPDLHLAASLPTIVSDGS